MRNINKIIICCLVLSGCILGDPVEFPLPGNIYRWQNGFCIQPETNSKVISYVVFKDFQQAKQKNIHVVDFKRTLCMDLKKLDANYIYVGHYATVINSVRRYYGFRIVKADGELFIVKAQGRYHLVK